MQTEEKMLNSWEEIAQALRRYPIRAEEHELTTFDWPVEGPVSAIFQVKGAELQGRQRIFIGVNVIKDAPARAHEALIINSETVVGAIAAFRGNLVLRQVMTVGRFDEAELHEVIAAMARTVDLAHDRLLAHGPSPLNTYVD